MKEDENNKVWSAYQRTQEMRPLFSLQGMISHFPLTYQDSLSPVPDHLICSIGMLTSKGEWGTKKGLAFVVEDNYLLTCASNCYSHTHGQYPQITFSISSNKQSGYDNHEVSKVFIPYQYQKLRWDQYNYALLYIEGEPNMKDQYGSLKVNFNRYSRPPASVKCVIKNQNLLELCGWDPVSEGPFLAVSGGPLITRDQVVGLIYMQRKGSKPHQVQFNRDTCFQLQLWAQIPKGSFRLKDLQSCQKDMSELKGLEKKSIDKIDLAKCNLEGISFSFFEKLPFTNINKLSLGDDQSRWGHIYHQIRNDLIFLKLDKFRNLRQLQLCQLGIGPIGCQIIASLPFTNLQLFNLSDNPIEKQGFRHIYQAQWPFLRFLYLRDCFIRNKVTGYLSQQKRNNLLDLDLQNNWINDEDSILFQNVSFPRINSLNICFSFIKATDLVFLRSPTWKTLTKLALSKNPIGTKGCKLFKQACIVLKQLKLGQCEIDSTGTKWLCKANLTKLNKFSFEKNLLRRQGCLTLSRANMPNLQAINLSEDCIDLNGMKSLFQAEWAKQLMHDYVLISLMQALSVSIFDPNV